MRRYWYDALPGKSKKSNVTTPAETGFGYCNQLFELEKKYKGLPPEERRARRLETEPPIWEAYWAWLETVNPQNGSRLAKAVTYARNQKPFMENYLEDGRCEISNNIAENIARPYVVGRKNFLFHNSVKGAQASAAIYSLAETAKQNGLKVFTYFKTILKIMQFHPEYVEDPAILEKLMPWSALMQKNCKDTKEPV